MRVAIIFPGQGSQYPKMGEDFKVHNAYNQVQNELYALNNEYLQAYNGDLDINQTKYAQPILFANQVGILNVVKKIYNVEDVTFAGFSLGEYSAYYGAGICDFQTGLKIVEKRSQLMDEVKSSYVTKVVIGLTKEQLQNVVKDVNKITKNEVIISNHNLEKQLLINYDWNDETIVIDTLKRGGAKRILSIAVSGPFHTKIYEDAAVKLSKFVKACELAYPKHELYLNVSGNSYDNQKIEQIMYQHMITGVNFKPQIEQMKKAGISTFIELGSSSVVSNLIKKIDRKAQVITIEKEADLNKLEEIWDKR